MQLGVSVVMMHVLILGCMAVSTIGCSRETEEDKVKNVVTVIQKAAEEKNLKKIVEVLAKTYRDPQEYDYSTIRTMLAGYFLKYPRISVYMMNIEVHVENKSAKALFQVILRGRNVQELDPPLGSGELGVYDFEVKFEKMEDEWKVVSAQWVRSDEKKR